MDSMPFLHSNQVFNIVFDEDLAFSEVRAILDYLLDRMLSAWMSKRQPGSMQLMWTMRLSRFGCQKRM